MLAFRSGLDSTLRLIRFSGHTSALFLDGASLQDPGFRLNREEVGAASLWKEEKVWKKE